MNGAACLIIETSAEINSEQGQAQRTFQHDVLTSLMNSEQERLDSTS